MDIESSHSTTQIIFQKSQPFVEVSSQFYGLYEAWNFCDFWDYKILSTAVEELDIMSRLRRAVSCTVNLYWSSRRGTGKCSSTPAIPKRTIYTKHPVYAHQLNM